MPEIRKKHMGIIEKIIQTYPVKIVSSLCLRPTVK